MATIATARIGKGVQPSPLGQEEAAIRRKASTTLRERGAGSGKDLMLWSAVKCRATQQGTHEAIGQLAPGIVRIHSSEGPPG
ncbi:MAG: hypothetical protein ABI824_04445 [Acidobacteriota bacterium]